MEILLDHSIILRLLDLFPNLSASLRIHFILNQGSEGKSWQHFAPMPGAPNARDQNTIEKLQNFHLKKPAGSKFIGQDQAFDAEQAPKRAPKRGFQKPSLPGHEKS